MFGWLKKKVGNYTFNICHYKIEEQCVFKYSIFNFKKTTRFPNSPADFRAPFSCFTAMAACFRPAC